jgi:hypothetical protein
MEGEQEGGREKGRERKRTYMEAISANDKATRVAPMPAKIPPYTMEAGPPFNSENWKVYAIASHADWTTTSKLMTEGKLMYRCKRINDKTLQQ